QDLSLFPHMSIAENIAFDGMVGTVPHLVNRKSYRQRAADVLARLGVTLDLDAPLHDLAIAERQIVAIARALMGDARLVFMDEPTASLTQSETDALLEIVRTLSKQGVTVVFVSHRLAEVLEISERVTVLRDGRLVGVYPTEGMTQTRLGELMTGQTLSATLRARDLNDQPAVLETHGLTRDGEFQDVSLTVRRGEVVGITGLIGAGRTELAHALIGMTRPDAGEILIDGASVSPRHMRDAIKSGIAYVSEDRLALGLIQRQAIADNIAITVLDRLLETANLLSIRRKTDLVADWIDRLAIKIGGPDDAVSTLSGGNQQRVVLAKWLATEPKVLILDSPTVGVDVGARAGIFEIVRDLANRGMAILMISDEVPETYYNADRILHMRGGRIVGTYDPRTADIDEVEVAVNA
ncbi:MAG: sugar ABC transporter ATP-binding protein, partial [Geminicoccaceae bacterium]